MNIEVKVKVIRGPTQLEQFEKKKHQADKENKGFSRGKVEKKGGKI